MFPYSIHKLAEQRLIEAGVDITNIRSPLELINEAMSSSDLPGVVSNVQNKALLKGYKYYGEYWKPWCSTRTAKDFKNIRVIRTTEIGNLQQVPGENLEALRFTSFDEEAINYAVNLFGIRVEQAMQLLVDDDLGALTKIVQKLGRSCARTISTAVCNFFNTNPNYEVDAVPIFNAGHANTQALALNAANLQAALLLLKTQTDANANPIEITRWTLVTCSALAYTAQQLYDQAGGRVAADAAPASFRNMGMQRPVEAPAITGPTAWFLVADPNDVDFLEIAYLRGLEQPKYLTGRGHWNEPLLGHYLGQNFSTENAVVWGWGIDCVDFRGAVRGNA